MKIRAPLSFAGALFVATIIASEPIAGQSVGRPTTTGAATALITLGTRGGPLPDKERAQSSNLLIVNNTLYLVDAGDGVTRRIVQAGYDFRQVRKILSHMRTAIIPTGS